MFFKNLVVNPSRHCVRQDVEVRPKDEINK